MTVMAMTTTTPLLTKEPPLSDTSLTPTESDAAAADLAEEIHDHEVATAPPEAALTGGHGTTTGISNNKLMMWVFLGSECLLFGALISTYLLYKERFQDKFGDDNPLGPSEIFDIPFTSVSSFVLLGSSLTMVLALSAISRADYHRFRVWTLTTAALGTTFIAGQIYEFTEFNEKGLGWSTNIFGSAFYTLTGFHGVHVSLGIVMLLATYIMHKQGRLNQDKAETVEIVGLYWHFVDIVWILIFTVIYLFPQ